MYFRNWPEAPHGQSEALSYDGSFPDACVTDAVFTVFLLQAFQGLVNPSDLSNILTEKEDLNSLFADVQRTMKEFGIGIFRVESADFEKGSFVITVSEDLDCSGIPVCSEEICTYDEGFIAGLLLAYSGKDFTVKEVDCWGTGHRICRFTAEPKRG